MSVQDPWHASSGSHTAFRCLLPTTAQSRVLPDERGCHRADCQIVDDGANALHPRFAAWLRSTSKRSIAAWLRQVFSPSLGSMLHRAACHGIFNIQDEWNTTHTMNSTLEQGVVGSHRQPGRLSLRLRQGSPFLCARVRGKLHLHVIPYPPLRSSDWRSPPVRFVRCNPTASRSRRASTYSLNGNVHALPGSIHVSFFLAVYFFLLSLSPPSTCGS